MSDLSVAPYRNGNANIKASFDVGAGPSLGLDDVVHILDDLAGEGEIDEALVRRVAFMQDWQHIVLGAKPRPGWKRTEAAGTTTAVCSIAELARIIAAMTSVRSHVARSDHARWDELTAFLKKCAQRGGTICLWYDPMG